MQRELAGVLTLSADGDASDENGQVAACPCAREMMMLQLCAVLRPFVHGSEIPCASLAPCLSALIARMPALYQFPGSSVKFALPWRKECDADFLIIGADAPAVIAQDAHVVQPVHEIMVGILRGIHGAELKIPDECVY